MATKTKMKMVTIPTQDGSRHLIAVDRITRIKFTPANPGAHCGFGSGALTPGPDPYNKQYDPAHPPTPAELKIWLGTDGPHYDHIVTGDAAAETLEKLRAAGVAA